MHASTVPPPRKNSCMKCRSVNPFSNLFSVGQFFQILKLIPSGGSCAGSKNMSHQMWGGSGAVCWCVWWSAGVLPAPGDLRGGGGKEQAKRQASENSGLTCITLDMLHECYVQACLVTHFWHYLIPSAWQSMVSYPDHPSTLEGGLGMRLQQITNCRVVMEHRNGRISLSLFSIMALQFHIVPMQCREITMLHVDHIRQKSPPACLVHIVCFSRYCRSVQTCQESVLLPQAHRFRYASLHSEPFFPPQKQFHQLSCISTFEQPRSQAFPLPVCDAKRVSKVVALFLHTTNDSVPPLVLMACGMQAWERGYH